MGKTLRQDKRADVDNLSTKRKYQMNKANQRVTDSQLQVVVDRINRITGSPMTPYTDGKINIGNYHLSGAYGGVCLHRMHNQGGGVSSPLSTGHIPKRELLNLMHAYIQGINDKAAA